MARQILWFLFAVLFPSLVVADAPTVTLMNGARQGTKMPVAGIGTWGYGEPGEVWNDDVAEKSIAQWLAMGGHRIDGSMGYGDQIGVGKAIKSCGVPGNEIFMTSKISLEGYNETITDRSSSKRPSNGLC